MFPRSKSLLAVVASLAILTLWCGDAFAQCSGSGGMPRGRGGSLGGPSTDLLTAASTTGDALSLQNNVAYLQMMSPRQQLLSQQRLIAARQQTSQRRSQELLAARRQRADRT